MLNKFLCSYMSKTTLEMWSETTSNFRGEWILERPLTCMTFGPVQNVHGDISSMPTHLPNPMNYYQLLGYGGKKNYYC